MANTGTGFDQILLKLLNAAEMGGHLLLECPFSALSFYLISKTSVLHPNLKFILLCQSACIFLRGFCRLSKFYFYRLINCCIIIIINFLKYFMNI
jgi:hypothetical protein